MFRYYSTAERAGKALARLGLGIGDSGLGARTVFPEHGRVRGLHRELCVGANKTLVITETPVTGKNQFGNFVMKC